MHDSSLASPLGTDTTGQAAAADEGHHHDEDNYSDDHTDKLDNTENEYIQEMTRTRRDATTIEVKS